MKHHRRPPAVRFPLRERRIPAAALLVTLLCGAAVLVTWRLEQDFRSGLLSAIWWSAWLWMAVVAALGWRWVKLLARDWLVWTGEGWELHTTTNSLATGAPRWQCRMTLDLQFAVLLRLDAAGPAPLAGGRLRAAQWVWAQHSSSPASWHALRQALVWSQQQQARARLSPELAA